MNEEFTPFPVEFFVEETPVSLQGSTRSKTRWKETVKKAARERIKETCEWYFLDRRPVALTIYYFPLVAMEGDVDNLVKPIMDALISVAYHDDRVVERVIVQKFEPEVEWEFTDPSDQLAAAIDTTLPVVYFSVSDDLNWRKV